jgi:hypothetical protein
VSKRASLKKEIDNLSKEELRKRCKTAKISCSGVKTVDAIEKLLDVELKEKSIQMEETKRD